MAKFPITGIAAVMQPLADPLRFTGSLPNADPLIEQSLPHTGSANPQNSAKSLSALRHRERVTTELFGLWLAAVFAGLLILNAISF